MQDKQSKRKTRRFTAEFKAHVLNQCREPGASIAGVALSHGLNANLVHKWRWMNGDTGTRHRRVAIQQQGRPVLMPSPAFIPMRVEPSVSTRSIDMLITRGATSIKLSVPSDMAACAEFLREILE